MISIVTNSRKENFPWTSLQICNQLSYEQQNKSKGRKCSNSWKSYYSGYFPGNVIYFRFYVLRNLDLKKIKLINIFIARLETLEQNKAITMYKIKITMYKTYINTNDMKWIYTHIMIPKVYIFFNYVHYLCICSYYGQFFMFEGTDSPIIIIYNFFLQNV